MFLLRNKKNYLRNYPQYSSHLGLCLKLLLSFKRDTLHFISLNLMETIAMRIETITIDSLYGP